MCMFSCKFVLTYLILSHGSDTVTILHNIPHEFSKQVVCWLFYIVIIVEIKKTDTK